MKSFDKFLQEKNGVSDDKKKAIDWIKKVYSTLYRNPIGNNYAMAWGEGDEQEIALFTLVPSRAINGAVDIEWFQAYPQRKGVGTKGMKALQKIAQKDNITLTLFPWSKGKISQTKLIKFYKSVGFKMYRGKVMYWEPK